MAYAQSELDRSAVPALYQKYSSLKNADIITNGRAHRPTFTWDELWSADEQYARRIWDMAAAYGYTYEGVDFTQLRKVGVPGCLEATQ
jgi:hypothetical protein